MYIDCYIPQIRNWTPWAGFLAPFGSPPGRNWMPSRTRPLRGPLSLGPASPKAVELQADYDGYLDPKSMSNNGPEPLNTTQKAFSLHTFGVQVVGPQVPLKGSRVGVPELV